jgi:hypothetical protein
MRVAMVQPNYLPWRGYFDLIDGVDLFVFYDDVPLGNGKKWRNRNRIPTRSGTTWLTVPLRAGQGDVRLSDVQIAPECRWQARHMGLLRDAYSRTMFPEYLARLDAIISTPCPRVADLDLELSRWLMSELGIETTTLQSSELGYPDGDKQQRPLGILERIGATEYVIGPAALGYTDAAEFARRGIRLEVKTFDYAPYPQLWPRFRGSVSVLDLLLCRGPDARRSLRSRSPNIVLASGRRRVSGGGAAARFASAEAHDG